MLANNVPLLYHAYSFVLKLPSFVGRNKVAGIKSQIRMDCHRDRSSGINTWAMPEQRKRSETCEMANFFGVCLFRPTSLLVPAYVFT